MSIRFRKIRRKLNPLDTQSEERIFPVVTYKYDRAATLSELSAKIAQQSVLGKGEVYNVLIYFCSQLQDTLLAGRQVNVEGLGCFFLSLQGKGAESEEDFTTNDITGIRICFRAHNDIRIHNGATTRTEGLEFLDVDNVKHGGVSTDDSETPEEPDDTTGGEDGGVTEDPLA